MDDKRIKVLLIEDSPGDARLIQELLAQTTSTSFDLTVSNRLKTGLEHLAAGEMDVVLLDLSLPDSHGLDTFARVYEHAPDMPIVVLSGSNDEDLANGAVHRGAQDYLIKGQIDSGLLARALRYAIERQRLQAELRRLSLTDELTGLYNRRGFLTLMEQELKSAARTRSSLSLLLADLDGLKEINDTFGHPEGDQALMNTANILKDTFRQADIIARLGGDEFVIAMGSSGNSTKYLTSRLEKNLKACNVKQKRAYKLSLTVGVAHYDPEHSASIQTLLATADEAMYASKRSRRKMFEG